MIKRSFFTLTPPTLNYESVEPDPKDAESIAIPSNLILLLAEPLDSTKLPLIKKGNPVKKGEKLRLYEDSTEYTISPVSGTVNAIDTFSDDFGQIATYLVLNRTQGQAGEAAAPRDDLKEEITWADEFLRTLPGAPPFRKLAAETTAIKTLIISCTDTDLLSTTRQYAAAKYLDDVKEGSRILKRMIKASQICLAVPENLPLQGDVDGFTVFKIPRQYPCAHPALIMKDQLKMVLPAGKTPEDCGVCFVSAEAAVSIAQAFKTKTIGFEKIITLVDKQGNRQQIKATMGTPVKKIFSQFNIHINDKDRIIIGGPLTGFSTYTDSHPVQPDMDLIIVQDRDVICEISDNPCVNCGKCIRICPADIPVNLLVRFLEAGQYEDAADKFDLEACIECGLCAYVCTAKIPLFQYIRLGKHELLKLRADA